jgi:zinc/manganese transport system substrate-binding protein
MSLVNVISLRAAGILIFALSLALAPATQAEAKPQQPLKVVTTLPDLAEVVRRVGGDAVTVEALLSGREDAHFVDAVPNFIRKVADADIVCVVGLELEMGWMPRVLPRSGNRKVQEGGQGYCEAGRAVETLDKPSGPIDRSMGDVHPSGNPHFNLSPKALAQAAGVVAQVLSQNRPKDAALFEKNLARFRQDMQTLENDIRERLKPAIELSKKQAIAIEYHKEFTYFFNLYGLRSYGSIEEKPGVPPSAARLADIATRAKNDGVKIAIGARYSPDRHFKRFSELSGIPFKQLPTAVHKEGDANSIESLQKLIADAILDGIGQETATPAR